MNYECLECNYIGNNIKGLNQHNKSKLHIYNTNNYYKKKYINDNNENKYKCIKCGFFTNDKLKYNIHIITLKHLNKK